MYQDIGNSNEGWCQMNLLALSWLITACHVHEKWYHHLLMGRPAECMRALSTPRNDLSTTKFFRTVAKIRHLPESKRIRQLVQVIRAGLGDFMEAHWLYVSVCTNSTLLGNIGLGYCRLAQVSSRDFGRIICLVHLGMIFWLECECASFALRPE